MALTARWNSSGIGFNGAGLRITGDGAEYRVRWGEGPDEIVTADEDSDGDGIADTASPFHVFNSDGTYDIAVFNYPVPGVPPVRLRAFMYASETDSITLAGSGLNEMFISGSGDDRISGANGDDWISAGDGIDRLYGQNGNDLLLGGNGNDFGYGGTGFDLLSGDDGDDILYGEGDGDSMYGGAGNDTLNGGDGDDYLDGQAGIDRLFGGAGADTFTFAPLRAPDGTLTLVDDPARDSILDFQQGTDHIDLTQWGPLEFIGSSAFNGTGAGQVRSVISGSATIILGDYDGDRTVDFSIRVAGTFTLSNDDLYLTSAGIAI